MFRKCLSIELVEPVVYLRGHPKDRQTVNILRGLVRLQLSHPVLVQAVTIQFVGTAKTLWPEAAQHWDKHILVDSVIPISRTPVTLKKGIHVFPFEILLSNALSESVECGLGHVRYKLLCHIHVKPTWSLFNSCLKAQRPVTLVRLPQENGPRCITQTHNLDGNEINVLVESAHITPGSPVGLTFSFASPPASIDQISMKLIERQKFRARAKRTTRVLHHEITLLPVDKRQSFVLNHRREVRCMFGVPDKETLQVHPSTSNSNIRVRHWIQILLCFTMPDGTSGQILMDSPVSVLMNAIEHYITLPAYDSVTHCPVSSTLPMPSTSTTTGDSVSASLQRSSRLAFWRSMPRTTNDRPPSYDDVYPRSSNLNE